MAVAWIRIAETIFEPSMVKVAEPDWVTAAVLIGVVEPVWVAATVWARSVDTVVGATVGTVVARLAVCVGNGEATGGVPSVACGVPDVGGKVGFAVWA